MIESLELEDESLIYADKEPDVNALTDAYDTCLIDLEYYFESCLRSYNDRRNIWDGKSDDLRKNGANAFPWQGASDQSPSFTPCEEGGGLCSQICHVAANIDQLRKG